MINPIIFGLPTLSLYFLFLLASKKVRGGSTPAGQSVREFDVFACGNRRKAVGYSRGAGVLIGTLFGGFFYLSAPVMIWRYGFLRPALLFALPFICATGVREMFGNQDFFLDCAMHVLVRATISVWLAVHDHSLVVAQLRRSGWVHAGTCGAASSSAALRNIFPSTSEHSSWIERLRGMQSGKSHKAQS